MFHDQLSPDVFNTQAEFIRVMDANKDFTFWADTLIVEETKELLKADQDNEGMEQIFKELADVVYVAAGFWNTMPRLPAMVLGDERFAEVMGHYDYAGLLVSQISTKYRIPTVLIEEAFHAVHASNMSKLDDHGKPIRREDGKVLKGPNYQAPNMAPIVMKWDKMIEQLNQKDPENESETS